MTMDVAGETFWAVGLGWDISKEFWYSNGTSMSNGGSVSEISPLANTLLTWEKGRKVNVGLDLTLLKNRLTLSADYYNDYYYDIFAITW